MSNGETVGAITLVGVNRHRMPFNLVLAGRQWLVGTDAWGNPDDWRPGAVVDQKSRVIPV